MSSVLDLDSGWPVNEERQKRMDHLKVLEQMRLQSRSVLQQNLKLDLEKKPGSARSEFFQSYQLPSSRMNRAETQTPRPRPMTGIAAKYREERANIFGTSKTESQDEPFGMKSSEFHGGARPKTSISDTVVSHRSYTGVGPMRSTIVRSHHSSLNDDNMGSYPVLSSDGQSSQNHSSLTRSQSNPQQLSQGQVLDEDEDDSFSSLNFDSQFQSSSSSQQDPASMLTLQLRPQHGEFQFSQSYPGSPLSMPNMPSLIRAESTSFDHIRGGEMSDSVSELLARCKQVRANVSRGSFDAGDISVNGQSHLDSYVTNGHAFSDQDLDIGQTDQLGEEMSLPSEQTIAADYTGVPPVSSQPRRQHTYKKITMDECVLEEPEVEPNGYEAQFGMENDDTVAQHERYNVAEPDPELVGPIALSPIKEEDSPKTQIKLDFKQKSEVSKPKHKISTISINSKSAVVQLHSTPSFEQEQTPEARTQSAERLDKKQLKKVRKTPLRNVQGGSYTTTLLQSGKLSTSDSTGSNDDWVVIDQLNVNKQSNNDSHAMTNVGSTTKVNSGDAADDTTSDSDMEGEYILASSSSEQSLDSDETMTGPGETTLIDQVDSFDVKDIQFCSSTELDKNSSSLTDSLKTESSDDSDKFVSAATSDSGDYDTAESDSSVTEVGSDFLTSPVMTPVRPSASGDDHIPTVEQMISQAAAAMSEMSRTEGNTSTDHAEEFITLPLSTLVVPGTSKRQESCAKQDNLSDSNIVSTTSVEQNAGTKESVKLKDALVPARDLSETVSTERVSGILVKTRHVSAQKTALPRDSVLCSVCRRNVSTEALLPKSIPASTLATSVKQMVTVETQTDEPLKMLSTTLFSKPVEIVEKVKQIDASTMTDLKNSTESKFNRQRAIPVQTMNSSNDGVASVKYDAGELHKQENTSHSGVNGVLIAPPRKNKLSLSIKPVESTPKQITSPLSPTNMSPSAFNTDRPVSAKQLNKQPVTNKSTLSSRLKSKSMESIGKSPLQVKSPESVPFVKSPESVQRSPARAKTPEPAYNPSRRKSSGSTDKLPRVISPEPHRVKSPEPPRVKSPEPLRVKSPEPTKIKSPEPIQKLSGKSPSPTSPKKSVARGKSPGPVLKSAAGRQSPKSPLSSKLKSLIKSPSPESSRKNTTTPTPSEQNSKAVSKVGSNPPEPAQIHESKLRSSPISDSPAENIIPPLLSLKTEFEKLNRPIPRVKSDGTSPVSPKSNNSKVTMTDAYEVLSSVTSSTGSVAKASVGAHTHVKHKPPPVPPKFKKHETVKRDEIDGAFEKETVPFKHIKDNPFVVSDVNRKPGKTMSRSQENLLASLPSDTLTLSQHAAELDVTDKQKAIGSSATDHTGGSVCTPMPTPSDKSSAREVITENMKPESNESASKSELVKHTKIEATVLETSHLAPSQELKSSTPVTSESVIPDQSVTSQSSLSVKSSVTIPPASKPPLPPSPASVAVSGESNSSAPASLVRMESSEELPFADDDKSIMSSLVSDKDKDSTVQSGIVIDQSGKLTDISALPLPDEVGKEITQQSKSEKVDATSPVIPSHLLAVLDSAFAPETLKKSTSLKEVQFGYDQHFESKGKQHIESIGKLTPKKGDGRKSMAAEGGRSVSMGKLETDVDEAMGYSSVAGSQMSLASQPFYTGSTQSLSNTSHISTGSVMETDIDAACAVRDENGEHVRFAENMCSDLAKTFVNIGSVDSLGNLIDDYKPPLPSSSPPESPVSPSGNDKKKTPEKYNRKNSRAKRKSWWKKQKN